MVPRLTQHKGNDQMANASEQEILRAQNKRLHAFLEVYKVFQEKGMTVEEVKEVMKEVGPPVLNIMGSWNFLKYLQEVADKVQPEYEPNEGFLD